MTPGRLYCRPLALQGAGFGRIAAVAHDFAARDTLFDDAPGVVAWREDIAFQDLDETVSPPREPVLVSARIAFLQLESVSEGEALVGVVASFSSLASAARYWLAEGRGFSPTALDIDLRGVLDDPDQAGWLAGYSIATDRGLESFVADPGRGLAGPPPQGEVRSLRIRGSQGDMELNQALELTLADPGDARWFEAAQDIRSAYALVAAGRPASLV